MLVSSVRSGYLASLCKYGCLGFRFSFEVCRVLCTCRGASETVFGSTVRSTLWRRQEATLLRGSQARQRVRRGGSDRTSNDVKAATPVGRAGRTGLSAVRGACSCSAVQQRVLQGKDRCGAPGTWSCSSRKRCSATGPRSSGTCSTTPGASGARGRFRGRCARAFRHALRSIRVWRCRDR